MTAEFSPIKAELVDHMGNDLSVVNAARVSFDKRSTWERPIISTEVYEHPHCGKEITSHTYGDPRLSEKDAKLIKYLAKHNHWTPFAHTQVTLRIKCPIPIRTQCFKHKFGFVENEESRRYVSYTPDFFMPEFREQADNKKQGSGSVMEGITQEKAKLSYASLINEAVAVYESLLARGVAEEQARFVLPQGAMVNFVWSGSLAAFARFYRQRSDSHAQLEIQELAQQVSSLIEPLYPVSWKALTTEE